MLANLKNPHPNVLHLGVKNGNKKTAASNFPCLATHVHKSQGRGRKGIILREINRKLLSFVTREENTLIAIEKTQREMNT